MDSKNNDTTNVENNNNEVGSNNNSLGGDNSNNSNLIDSNSNQIGNNNNSNTTTGNSTLATVCENDYDTLVDLNLMCVMMDQCSKFEDSSSVCEVGIENKYEDDVDSYVYNENLSIDINDEWNLDKVIEDVAKESIIIVDEEESNVRNMHEIRMLDLGSMLVEKETNVMSTSTNTYIGIDNDNGIKFEYNDIKMNNLRWSKPNHDVKRYKEVTKSNNNLKVFRIYDR